MGLDVEYYSRCKPINPEEYSSPQLYEMKAVSYFTVPGCEDRLEGFDAKWIVGEYVGSFSAGSYSGYNDFRAVLSECMLGVRPRVVWEHPDVYRDKPFYGLINFADNEGCIGPVWSARLAREFEEGRERFKTFVTFGQGKLGYSGWLLTLYDSWSVAFKAAADGGCVKLT